MSSTSVWVVLLLMVVGLAAAIHVRADAADVVLPSLRANLISYYDFDHPVTGDPATEADQGRSGTNIRLVNGGAAMRTGDAAYPAAGQSMQTRQVNPDATANDDWKAGVYLAGGLGSLNTFSAVAAVTVMGWVKPTGENPSPNSTTAAAGDYYGAVGLFGLLSGTSDGHAVRALLEIIDVSGALRLVALGRRLDAGNSHTLAATDDWRTLLPANTWTHLAATFDFDNGTMALYRNGEPLPASYTSEDDRWDVSGGPEPDLVSATNPAGIKIGGSYPQNSQERNPFNGRFDDLMFFDRSLTVEEVHAQFARFASVAPVPVAR